MLDEEAGSKIIFQNFGREMIECPTTSRTAANGVEYAIHFETGSMSVEQRFADSDHRAGDDDLVAQLRMLAGAGSTLVHDCLTQTFHERHDRLHGGGVASHHDRKSGIPRAYVTA